jgi:hypothetical protein
VDRDVEIGRVDRRRLTGQVIGDRERDAGPARGPLLCLLYPLFVFLILRIPTFYFFVRLWLGLRLGLHGLGCQVQHRPFRDWFLYGVQIDGHVCGRAHGCRPARAGVHDG